MRKGKLALLEAVLKHQEFIRLFANLGSRPVSESTLQVFANIGEIRRYGSWKPKDLMN